MNEPNAQFETPRLIVRAATSDDALLIVSLWSDPRVMRYVGFPRGIPTAAEDVPRRIERGKGLDALLVARPSASGEPIGQCMLGTPDSFGVCDPDIKLHHRSGDAATGAGCGQPSSTSSSGTHRAPRSEERRTSRTSRRSGCRRARG
jgi:RimJ/RimL family protein N-acetyltransferase